MLKYGDYYEPIINRFKFKHDHFKTKALYDINDNKLATFLRKVKHYIITMSFVVNLYHHINTKNEYDHFLK